MPRHTSSGQYLPSNVQWLGRLHRDGEAEAACVRIIHYRCLVLLLLRCRRLSRPSSSMERGEPLLCVYVRSVCVSSGANGTGCKRVSTSTSKEGRGACVPSKQSPSPSYPGQGRRQTRVSRCHTQPPHDVRKRAGSCRRGLVCCPPDEGLEKKQEDAPRSMLLARLAESTSTSSGGGKAGTILAAKYACALCSCGCV
jgi:hypothetical protein